MHPALEPQSFRGAESIRSSQRHRIGPSSGRAQAWICRACRKFHRRRAGAGARCRFSAASARSRGIAAGAYWADTRPRGAPWRRYWWSRWRCRSSWCSDRSTRNGWSTKVLVSADRDLLVVLGLGFGLALLLQVWHRLAARLGRDAAIGVARLAMDGQRVRASVALADGLFRKAPPGRYHVAAILGAGDTANLDHQLRRGRSSMVCSRWSHSC